MPSAYSRSRSRRPFHLAEGWGDIVKSNGYGVQRRVRRGRVRPARRCRGRSRPRAGHRRSPGRRTSRGRHRRGARRGPFRSAPGQLSRGLTPAHVAPARRQLRSHFTAHHEDRLRPVLRFVDEGTVLPSTTPHQFAAHHDHTRRDGLSKGPPPGRARREAPRRGHPPTDDRPPPPEAPPGIATDPLPPKRGVGRSPRLRRPTRRPPPPRRTSARRRSPPPRRAPPAPDPR